MKQRIVICCDGTWNRPSDSDENETNVQRMYKLTKEGIVEDGWEQTLYYDSGVGSSTYSWRDQILGGITGQGIDQNIIDAYTFVTMNYNPGDELYLFGFSRGAYTVRSLAGLIRNCGILTPGNIGLVEKAYGLYRNRNNYATPDSSMMKGFKKHYTHYNAEGEVNIKFIGVWDSVGSLGLPVRFFLKRNHEKYKFHSVTLSSYVENAYHALAVDELRVPFKPSLWEMSETVSNDQSHIQKMEQRWFIGVHSNVGGGYHNCKLRNTTLKWIAGKAKDVGLKMNYDAIEKLAIDHTQKPAKSMLWYYKLLGVHWREINPHSDKKPGKTREFVDESVRDRYYKDAAYKPRNLNGKI